MGLLLLAAAPAHALTTTYTDSAAFNAALPGAASTLDFDSLPSGGLLPSGTTRDGVTFTYSIDGLTLKVTDAFDTTSGQNSLACVFRSIVNT